jgi:phosphoglycolate phosphatase-like HAD superfamily hydrolase
MQYRSAAMRAVLFDVDGTLIKAQGAGREALARGVARVLGAPLEAVRAEARAIDFRGRTDELLIEELVRRAGGVPESGLDARVVAAYLEELETALAEVVVEVLPGVPELLAALALRDDAAVGLLTGNVREGARRKLDAVGLGWLAARDGGFAEDGRERDELARAAMARLAAQGVGAGRVVVIGDTPHDVAAARAIGARAVAVASGWTPRAELAPSRPDLLLDSLAGLRQVLELLDAL